MYETVTETIVVETCCECGITFGMTQGYYDLRQRDGESFHCPNGHRQFYTNSEKKKMADIKKELQRTQENMQFWHDQAEEKARSLSATRGQITKIKNRVAKGICPCCNRQFTNLHDHMETKHPNYGKPE